MGWRGGEESWVLGGADGGHGYNKWSQFQFQASKSGREGERLNEKGVR